MMGECDAQALTRNAAFGLKYRINGTPAIRLRVTKQSGENTVAIAEAVKAEIERINNSEILPPGVLNVITGTGAGALNTGMRRATTDFTAITDCGAGGLSSAVGEMGEKTGATVDLEKVPLKYAGLAPWEILLSEAQERMTLAVPRALFAFGRDGFLPKHMAAVHPAFHTPWLAIVSTTRSKSPASGGPTRLKPTGM